MSEIKSQLSIAQVHATTLSTASQSLTAVETAESDGQTTVSGNAQAHQAISLAQTTASQVSEMLTGFSQNLQSVASDFQALDQAEARKFGLA